MEGFRSLLAHWAPASGVGELRRPIELRRRTTIYSRSSQLYRMVIVHSHHFK